MADPFKANVSPGSKKKHTYSERMDVVDLVSSDEETAESARKRPRLHSPREAGTAGYAGSGFDEDDDDLQVVSCTRARAPKSSQARGDGRAPPGNKDAKEEGAGTDAHAKRLRFGNGSEGGNAVGNTEGGGTGDQLEVVESRSGVQPLKDYPHFRFHCVTHPFKRQRVTRKQLYCGNCYCYVCDINAENCSEWAEHCKATDTVTQWQKSRQEKKNDRRKSNIDPAQRGTHYARILTPGVVENLASGSDSDDDGMSTDSVEGVQWYRGVDDSGVEKESLAMDSVVNGTGRFSIGNMSKLFEGTEQRTASRRRKPSTFDICNSKLL